MIAIPFEVESWFGFKVQISLLLFMFLDLSAGWLPKFLSISIQLCKGCKWWKRTPVVEMDSQFPYSVVELEELCLSCFYFPFMYSLYVLTHFVLMLTFII